MGFFKSCQSTHQYLYWLSIFPIRNRSFTNVCFCVSLVSLILQFLVFLLLMYTLEGNSDSLGLGLFTSSLDSQGRISSVGEDIKVLISLSLELGFSLISLDKNIINREYKLRKNISVESLYCLQCRPVVLALDISTLGDKRNQFLTQLVDEEFVPLTFYNIQPLQIVSELNRVETAVLLQRTATFQVVMLYPREDNTWWFGDVHSDPSHEVKLSTFNLSLDQIEIMKTEGAVERFEIVPSSLEEESHLMFPKDIPKYLSDIENSKFIECNMTRAAAFHRRYGSDKSAQAMKFRHKVWKMLSRVKTVLDSLGIVFWLSSGTALGYFRECDIIAHSKDVDIGVWASSYSEKIVKEMYNHGFRLKISLGFPNDSLELSFLDQSGIKLDIFFFYQEDTYYWNGGTQVKSGKKFKYAFSKFTLCWTLFKDLRLHVPCETEEYSRANYGPNWFKPVKSWDWKTSPFNVKPNGQWKKEQLATAIKLYV